MYRAITVAALLLAACAGTDSTANQRVETADSAGVHEDEKPRVEVYGLRK
jgi:hypothetical protein